MDLTQARIMAVTRPKEELYDLEADPFVFDDFAGGHANLESVAPRLAARGTSSHLLPVAIEVPCGEVARFDLSAPASITCWSHARSTLRPRCRWVKTKQSSSIMMNRSVLAVELHVEAKIELVVPVAPVLVLDATVEVTTVPVALRTTGHATK